MKKYVLIFFITFLSFLTSTVYAVTPNDPRLSSQWGLTKIQAQNAWSITTGSSSLIVAVIDDGIPSSTANHHEEFPSTKLVAGHDFFNDASGEDSDPSPEGQSWHGTHCAGIIGAATNNNLGIAGLCWNCKIMPLKVYNSIPNLMQESAWSKAIRYAVDNGAKIISMSIGFDGFSSSQIQDLKNAVTYAEQHDVLIITAAGNNGYNIDTHYVYPASFASTQSNLIAVAATNETDQILWNDTAKIYSNYGAQNVGLGAPGDRILSTVPLAVDSSGYAQAVGTSQATAFAAGVASLMKSKNPLLSAKNIKCKILKSVDPASSLSGKTVSGGRLNAYSALTSSSYICDSSSTIKECDASADCNGKNPNDYTCVNNNHVKRICDSNCKSSDICDNTKCPSSTECYNRAPGSNFCVSGYPLRIYCDSSCSASYVCDNTCASSGSAECNGKSPYGGGFF
jgi:subtilisin family serine protease